MDRPRKNVTSLPTTEVGSLLLLLLCVDATWHIRQEV